MADREWRAYWNNLLASEIWPEDVMAPEPGKKTDQTGEPDESPNETTYHVLRTLIKQSDATDDQQQQMLALLLELYVRMNRD